MKKKEKIILSLTSYPARIEKLYKVIQTLLIQTMKADKILVWLSLEEFPQKGRELPSQLMEMKKYGLEIRWCKDLKPHKKYFYVMQEFPDDIIITVDDDVYYSPVLIERLYKSYLRFPFAVSCARANRITLGNDGKTEEYSKWQRVNSEYENKPAMDLLAVGVGGILYPPKCLPQESFNEETIHQTCLYQDDLWLKIMELKKNVPVVLIEAQDCPIIYVENTQKTALHSSVNQKGNDVAIQKINAVFEEKTGENCFFSKRIQQSKLTTVHHDQEQEAYGKELIDKMRQFERVIIFGAGVGAKTVFECIKSNAADIGLYCFAVTDMKVNPDSLFQIPVMDIEDLVQDCKESLVLVSTAEKVQKEITEKLEALGFKNIWLVKDTIMGKIVDGNRAKEKFFSSGIRQVRVKE